jgi:hypothetical protein
LFIWCGFFFVVAAAAAAAVVVVDVVLFFFHSRLFAAFLNGLFELLYIWISR